MHRILLSLVALCISTLATADPTPYEIGPWRLGMSTTEVTSFEQQGPYESVKATGGYETHNALVNGKKTNVSFVFKNDKLDFIQVWKYEGPDFTLAKNAALEMFDEMTEKFGGATIPNIEVKGPHGFDHGALNAVLETTLRTAPDLSDKWAKEKGVVGTFTFDLIPKSQPDGSRLHGKIAYSGRYHTFYVFLFQDRTDAPDRRAASNIKLEKL